MIISHPNFVVDGGSKLCYLNVRKGMSDGVG